MTKIAINTDIGLSTNSEILSITSPVTDSPSDLDKVVYNVYNINPTMIKKNISIAMLVGFVPLLEGIPSISLLFLFEK